MVKIPGCDFIVEGIIKYVKNGDTIAAIDFGDGTCDEWAFKTWVDKNNNIKTIEFSKKKIKKSIISLLRNKSKKAKLFYGAVPAAPKILKILSRSNLNKINFKKTFDFLKN